MFTKEEEEAYIRKEYLRTEGRPELESLPGEVWTTVVVDGEEYIYNKVSTEGRMRTLPRIVRKGTLNKHRDVKVRNKICKLGKFSKNGGYLEVPLVSNDGTTVKYAAIHRVVQESFRGAIPEGLVVNHIDENKRNNKLENLNLLTIGDNVRYGTAKQRSAAAQSKPCVCTDPESGRVVASFGSMTQAAAYAHEKLGARKNCVSVIYYAIKYAKKQYGLMWSLCKRDKQDDQGSFFDIQSEEFFGSLCNVYKALKNLAAHVGYSLEELRESAA